MQIIKTTFKDFKIEDFKEDVAIFDVSGQIPACKLWNDEKYLRDVYGNMRLRYNEIPHAHRFETLQGTETLNELLDFMKEWKDNYYKKSKSKKEEGYKYVFDTGFLAMVRGTGFKDELLSGLDVPLEIHKDIPPLKKLLGIDSWMNPRIRVLTFTLGPINTGVDLHNHLGVFNTSIIGRKRWHVFPGTDHNKDLYREKFSLFLGNKSYRKEIKEIKHILERDVEYYYTFIQEPGEMVWIPDDCYHATKCLTNHIGFVSGLSKRTNLTLDQQMITR